MGFRSRNRKRGQEGEKAQTRRSLRSRPPPRPLALAAGLPGAVQAAGRIALEVDRDEPVAGRPQRLDDAIALRHQARKLGRLDLDSRDIAVMTYAHLCEAEGLDRRLGGFDLTQGLDCDLGAVRDSRRQAGERGLVPVGESEPACGGTNLRFAHADLEQREANAASNGGAVAGPVVARIVSGGAVRDVAEAEVVSNRLPRFEALFLAVETARRIVPSVTVQLHLVGGNLGHPG